MTDLLRKDPKFMRSAILYEVFRDTPIFEAYENFCEAMGEDAMEYREFESWYMKFARGNYDLTSDEKLPSNNRLLLDMPIEILQKIVKDTTWKDVIELRQVSRKTRAIVDKTKLVYKECTIIANDIITTMSIDGESEEYRTTFPDDWCQSDLVRDVFNTAQAFHEIHVLMKHPKVYLEKLVLDTRSLSDDENCLEIDFKTYHLRVKKICAIGECAETYCILDCLEPGTLEEIEFENDDMCCTAKGDQWKQAKCLKIGRCNGYISWQDIEHFARIDIKDFPLKVEKVIALKNRFIESPTFEKCRLGAKENNDSDDYMSRTLSLLEITAIEEQLGPHVREDSDDQNYRRYTIKEG